MAVMPEGRDTEEPDAGHGNEQAAGAPPEDILARLLEYRRRLQEEIGGEPASFGEELDAPPSAHNEQVPAAPVAAAASTHVVRTTAATAPRSQRMCGS